MSEKMKTLVTFGLVLIVGPFLMWASMKYQSSLPKGGDKNVERQYDELRRKERVPEQANTRILDEE